MPPVLHPIPTDEERAATLLAEALYARRHVRRVFLRAILLCFAFLGAGLFLIGWAVHTTDLQLGLIAFWSGLLVGNAGILVTLATTFSRAMDEGWL